MFTGIIEGKGKVLRIERRGEARRLTIEFPSHLTDVQLGDSISINGVCLTIVEKKDQASKFDLSEETIKRSGLGELKEGDPVNLERALGLNGRLGGHFVTGHIDGIGVITEKIKERDFVNLRVRVPENVSKYVVSKGAVAIDGISLTVNECRGNEILLTLIPYTLEKTTLMDQRVGDHVNLEADILGKYVEQLISHKSAKPKGLDRSFLEEHGFLKGDGGSDG
ncbi:MAG: riboflavin synthase [Deltaproteobacteria bacterium]|nr:riboflavin synthase [Deltaproteobacteria bacterium]